MPPPPVETSENDVHVGSKRDILEMHDQLLGRSGEKKGTLSKPAVQALLYPLLAAVAHINLFLRVVLGKEGRQLQGK